MKKVMIAGVQMDVKIKDKKSNLDKAINSCKEAHKNGAKIVVFPECALTGYVYSDFQEVVSVAEPIPGPSTESMRRICKESLIPRQSRGLE
jgi:predicted amidohydrolase